MTPFAYRRCDQGYFLGHGLKPLTLSTVAPAYQPARHFAISYLRCPEAKRDVL